MDRGEVQRDNLASAHGLEGMAAGASTRVGEILAEAERLAREIHADADRAAAATRREAEREVERIAAEAREAARAAARERAAELAALMAALTARGPAVVEGLEGAGLTRARLEAVIDALDAAAGEVRAAAEGGDPRAGAHDEAASEASPAGDPEGSDADTAAGEGEAPALAEPAEAEAGDLAEAEAPALEEPAEPQPDESAEAESEEPAEAEAEPDPVAVAEDLAKPVADPPPADEPEPAPAAPLSVNGAVDGQVAYDGALPQGAPIARKPQRSRERDARFAALLLAVQGRPRDEVDAHLRSEYGFADVEPILDEVFGPAPA